MTHTTENIARTELRQRSAIHQGFMGSMIRKGQGAIHLQINKQLFDKLLSNKLKILDNKCLVMV